MPLVRALDMAENTTIEWTDNTQNFWEGCQEIGPGCLHCYAKTRNARFGGGSATNWGPGAPRRRTGAKNWAKPKAWNAAHGKFFAQHGRRQRVFCSSLSDIFDNQVPIEWLVDALEVIRTTPNLDWQLLTKRIGLARSRLLQANEYVVGNWPAEEAVPLSRWLVDWLEGDNPPANVWLGATIVNQEEADRDILKLLAMPARVRFLSMEPLLGPVNLTSIRVGGGGFHEFDPIIFANVLHRAEAFPPLPKIDWVIVGGESGPGARPMHPDWARSLRDQCSAYGTPFLFKQWGDWGTAAFFTSTGLPVFRQFPDYQTWVNKARTWVSGGICLDTEGRQLDIGADFARARDEGRFPITIMHRIGKKNAGRLLDGMTWDGFPNAAPAAEFKTLKSATHSNSCHQ